MSSVYSDITAMNSTRYDRAAAAEKRKQSAAGLRGQFAVQAASNPYEGREFTPSFWQHLGEQLLGDYSARDKWYAEQDQAADEYVSQLLDAQRQQDYNSPAAQAARARAAGQNPDLIGTEGASEAAAAAPDDTPPTMDQGTNPFEGLSSIVSSVGSVIGVLSGGVSFFQALEDLNGSRIRNDWMDINGALGAYPGLMTALAGSETEGQVIPGENGELDAVVKTAGPKLSDLLSSRSGKRLRQYLGNHPEGTKGFIAAREALRKGTLTDMQGSVSVMNTPGFQEDVVSWSIGYKAAYGDLLNEEAKANLEYQKAVWQYDLKLHSPDMADAEYDATIASFEEAESQSDYMRDYYNKLDPDVAASAANDTERTKFVQNALARRDATIRKATMEWYAKRVEDINKSDYDPATKQILINGVLEERNQWMREQMQLDSEAAARGSGVITEKDWLTAGSQTLGEIFGLGGRVIGAKAGKRPRRHNPSGGTR